MRVLFANGVLVLADRVALGSVVVRDGRIERILIGSDEPPGWDQRVDLESNYLCPGFVDLHVHGGDGADFMDGSEEAFHTACRAHLRHGTTSLLPTSCVATHDRILKFLALCDRARSHAWAGARVLGAHLYGPFFAPEAKGCHPGRALRTPSEAEWRAFLDAGCVVTASIAPELPASEAFARECRRRGIRVNIGHSLATFDQVRQAIEWGAAHVDHLFCAMSDRARLRQQQAYPMRGGVVEATLFFDELTTEVIADGKHLQRELLQLAYKIKGPDRLALVTDCSRALDMPDGTYIFGPEDDGEPFLKRDGVGLLPDGKALASSVVGMDHMVRTMHRLTGIPLYEVVRMASLTPARIIGRDDDLGSLTEGKRADFVVLDRELTVWSVWLGGRLVHAA
ncbi:MAG: N-acetylglucosamine-6-phosphate deacetylase [Gemmatales bacterium]|nr:N-acetylglucosamine-6-phosphate deacetylase [Gemmatales bacterium]MDW8386609.1 N-acetylglucosamine-6-phosphate deacetylase [Gemmatales bacterium]